MFTVYASTTIIIMGRKEERHQSWRAVAHRAYRILESAKKKSRKKKKNLTFINNLRRKENFQVECVISDCERYSNNEEYNTLYSSAAGWMSLEKATPARNAMGK